MQGIKALVVDQIEEQIDNLNEELADDDGSRMMELVIMLDHILRVKDYFEKGMECNEPS